MGNHNFHNLNSNSLEKALFSVFEKNPDLAIPADLSARIVAAVLRRQRLNAIIKLSLGSFFSIGSFVVGLLIWRYENLTLAGSGVSRLLSLLFSDFSVVMSFWKEYLLSVAESLPLAPLAAVLAFVWLCLVNLRFALKNYSFLTHHAVKHV